MIRAGELRDRVRVFELPKEDHSNATEGEAVELSPSPVWAAIRPAAPGAGSDERTTSHAVTLRYHAGITAHALLKTMDGRRLFVRGVQNVDNAGVELQLLCEEVS